MGAGCGRVGRCCGLVLGAMLAMAAGAQPLAPWVAADGLDDLQQRRLAHLERSRCIPDTAEVAWPAYPGAVLAGVQWGRMKPGCAARDGWSDLGGVVLLSRASREEVAAWYAEQLDGYQRYEGPRGILFIDIAIDDFLWDRDYYKYPNIALVTPRGPWTAQGYRTRIEFNRPAP